MIDYNRMPIQDLLDMAHFAEEEPSQLFNMAHFSALTECGTTHCLLGLWSVKTRDQRQQSGLEDVFPFATPKCIPHNIFRFLFSCHAYKRMEDIIRGGRPKTGYTSKSAIYLTQEEAIARLYKFIAYCIRKKELFADYEVARRTGDAGIMAGVKEDVEEGCYVNA